MGETVNFTTCAYSTQASTSRTSVRHFTFDTRTQTFEASDTKDSDSQAVQASDTTNVPDWTASETSANEDLDSYWVLYAKYRHRWPNYILAALIIAGESMIVFWVWKVWATVEPAVQDE
jgi:hypothetical protein